MANAIAVGESLNGFQVRATCLMSNWVRTNTVPHVVILGVRDRKSATSPHEFVVARMTPGASEWWQGFYTTDGAVAAREFLRQSELGAIADVVT
jgi:hypothetical protein